MSRGKYIVLEGTDGTGKNTQVDLLKGWLRKEGVPLLETDISEPAGTPFADAVRDVIKNGRLERDPLANLLLFNAARHSIYHELIKPSLENGLWVVTARNYLSSLTYQGHAQGLSREDILRRVEQDTAPEYMHPDMTIVLDIDDETVRAQRIAERGTLEKPDTFEMQNQEFQDKIIAGYRTEAELLGYPVIDAGSKVDDIHIAITSLVRVLL